MLLISYIYYSRTRSTTWVGSLVTPTINSREFYNTVYTLDLDIEKFWTDYYNYEDENFPDRTALRRRTNKKMPTEQTDIQRLQQENARLAESLRVQQEQQRLLDAATTNNNTETTALEEVHAMRAAALKMPAFMKAHPESWFLQAETLFQGHKITSDATKFMHVVSALDGDTMVALSDVIRTAPTTGKYEHLKKHILARYADSEEKQLQRLLTGLHLGDEKPSALLARMRTLATNKMSDDILKVHWADQLPSNIRPFLKVIKSASIDDLASLADSLMEGQASTICATNMRATQPAITSRVDAELAEMRGLITALQAMVTTLMTQGQQNRSRSRSKRPHQRQQSQQRQANPAWCYYHQRWGAAAQKCRQPCSYSNNLN